MTDEQEIEKNRGESLSNSWTTERFTCPICLTDHDVLGLSEQMAGEEYKYKRCECGAPLVFEIVMAPEAKCTVMDKDDEEEYLVADNDDFISDADNPENKTGFASFNDTMS